MAKTTQEMAPVDNDPAASNAPAAVQTTLQGLLHAATVAAVFGSPVRQGRRIVVPAAEVLAVIGFGFGAGGMGRSEASPDMNGSGGGGGGYVFARPVAAVVIEPEGVSQRPIIDITKIALAALTAAGFVASMVFQMRRRGRLSDAG